MSSYCEPYAVEDITKNLKMQLNKLAIKVDLDVKEWNLHTVDPETLKELLKLSYKLETQIEFLNLSLSLEIKQNETKTETIDQIMEILKRYEYKKEKNKDIQPPEKTLYEKIFGSKRHKR